MLSTPMLPPSSLIDADWPGAWPAIVVSSHARRYHRAASVLRLHGFSVRWSPAVFVGHQRECMPRIQWASHGHAPCVENNRGTNRSMAVFEDDVSPAENSEAASLTSEMHAFILKYQQQHDVLWLGGLARIGACSTANPFGNGCYPTRLSLPGGRGTSSTRRPPSSPTTQSGLRWEAPRWLCAALSFASNRLGGARMEYSRPHARERRGRSRLI